MIFHVMRWISFQILILSLYEKMPQAQFRYQIIVITQLQLSNIGWKDVEIWGLSLLYLSLLIGVFESMKVVFSSLVYMYQVV